jgi:hypothetical protein
MQLTDSYPGKSRRKRKADGADQEESLLEARRKRLLQQQDWAGLARSKPIPTHFLSSAEKEKIGKRRKIKGGCMLEVMPRSNPSPARQPENRHQRQPDFYMGSALPTENIKIRVGTDALSSTQLTAVDTQAATIPHDSSSDIMLFDDEAIHSARQLSPGPARIADQEPRAFVGGHSQVRAPPELRGEGLQAQASDHKRGTPYRTRAFDGAPRDWAQSEYAQRSLASVGIYNEANKVLACYMMQGIGGVDHPTHLVLDQASDFLPAVEGGTTQLGSMIGETNHVHFPANASLCEHGNHQEHSEANCAAVGQAQVVNDCDWWSFLSITGNISNRSITTDAGHSDTLSYDPTSLASKPATGTIPVPWSQRATQDGQTCPYSSSCVSASLPSITRDSEKGTLGRQLDKTSKWGLRLETKQQDEDEQLWQSFVFGNDIAAVSDVANDEVAVNADEDTVSRPAVPSSVVVGSPSSRPFRLESEFTGCLSESVRDEAVDAPRSSSGFTLPITTASPLRRPAQEHGKDREGNGTRQTVESSDLGVYRASHTSIQNNVPIDTSSAFKISGDRQLQTSNYDGHERSEGYDNSHNVPTRASSHEATWFYNTPVGDNSDELSLIKYC